MIHERVYTTVVRRADVNAHIYSSYRGEISISQVLPLCLLPLPLEQLILRLFHGKWHTIDIFKTAF